MCLCSPRALILALAALLAPVSGAAEPHALFLQAFEWEERGKWFGGLSAVHVAPGGTSGIVIGDRAVRAEITISRDRDGRITAVRPGKPEILRSLSNAKLQGPTGDAEGLAVTREGREYISFEHLHRVSRYTIPGGPARVLPRPPEMRDLPKNKGLEALAIDAREHLYAIPEGDGNGRVPVLRWDGRNWTMPLVLESTRGFSAVGADIGPDGKLYVLERKFRIWGFSSRLRRIDIATGSADTVMQSDPGLHDNLEGVSIWRNGKGQLIATMVSDDNFRNFQRTEIVEYALPE